MGLIQTPTISGSPNYLLLTLGFVVAEQALEFYLSYRQRKVLKKTLPPTDLIEEARNIDPSYEKELTRRFGEGREYNLEKNLFSFISEAFDTVFKVVSSLLRMSPKIYSLAKNCATNTVQYAPFLSTITLTNIYFTLAGSLVSTVFSLPFAIYSTFVIEEKHGFNKTDARTFIMDLLKNFVIGNTMGIMVMQGIVYLVGFFQAYFHWYVSIFMMLVTLVMMFIYPNFIMPLFNTFTPLQDIPERKKLYGEISKLANELDYPLQKVFLVDGSKRSGHSNAYLFGFWKNKRIVLYDTLFGKGTEGELDQGCTDEEVVAILSHELGHWSMSHTLKGFVFQQFTLLSMMKLFNLFVNSSETAKVYADFGYVGADDSVLIGLSLFSELLTPLHTVLSLVGNSMTRKYEFEADAFAASLGKADDLKKGLMKISVANLSALEVDPLFHSVHHSHPTLYDRLQALNKVSKKNA